MNNDTNKAVVKRYAEMFNIGDSAIALEILADTYIDHAHPELIGLQAIRQSVEKTREAMPDFHIEMSSIIAEGDLVACKETLTMTRQGEKLIRNGMSFHRLKHGKIIERWTCYEASQ